MPALERLLFNGPNGNESFYYDASVRPDPFNLLKLNASYYLLSLGEVVSY